MSLKISIDTFAEYFATITHKSSTVKLLTYFIVFNTYNKSDADLKMIMEVFHKQDYLPGCVTAHYDPNLTTKTLVCYIL